MIFTLVIAFLSLIALMIIHELGHFVIAKKFGARVDEFGIGYPPRIFGKKVGETIYSINLIPLGAFVKIYGEEGGLDDYRSFSGLEIWKRVLIVLGGVLAFWIAAIAIFSVVFMVGAQAPVGDSDIPGVERFSVKIIDILPESPAEKEGLKAGDLLLDAISSSDELKINKVSDFQKFTQDNKGKEIILTANRNGKPMSFKVIPRDSYPAEEGPLGIKLERMANIIEKSPWYEAPVRGAIYCVKITYQAIAGIFGFFKSLFAGNGIPPGAEMAGPVGITIFLAKAADFGIGFFLYFIGSIAVFVALFNLFPIPALDGGKLIFLAIEKIKKKPVSLKVEQGITIFFFILLVSMSIFVTAKFDIPRAIDFWKAST